jgi:hypothetical protein
MVAVPERADPPLDLIASVELPLPVLEPPVVTEMNAALLSAPQMQLAADAVTLMVRDPPVASTLALVAESVNAHPVPPDCNTVTVFPATVTVPVREDDPVFVATSNVTAPLPLPLPPDVIVMNGALLVALHAHPGEVVTVTVTGPPPEMTAGDSGLTLYKQFVVCTFKTTSLEGALVPHAFFAFTRT